MGRRLHLARNRVAAVVLTLAMIAGIAVVVGVTSSTAGADTVVRRVNAGGAALSGSPSWEGDSVATPSTALLNPTHTKVSSSGATIDTSDPSLPAGTPAALFQSERWDPIGKSDMSWSLPVTAGATYEVRLYFAETYAPNFVTGARVFDVELEGTTVLDNFDVFAQAGAGNRGIMRSFQVAASDASLGLVFRHVVENPLVDGIELIELGGAGPGDAELGASPLALTFPSMQAGGSATQQAELTNNAPAGSASVEITDITISGAGAAAYSDDFIGPVTLAPGESTTVDVTFSPAGAGTFVAALGVVHDAAGSPLVISLSGTASAAPPSGGEVLYRVNAGGPVIDATDPWTVDTTATPSPYLVTPTNHKVASSGATIDTSDASLPADTPAELFQTERWDALGKSELTWSFPTTPGQYEVRLYFAETYAPLFVAGGRVFDVELEGNLVLDNFDQFVAAGGGNRGIMRSFVVDADTSIDLRLLHVTDNPAVKAIEIVAPGAVSADPELSASPTSVTFADTEVGSTATAQVTLTNSGQAGAGSLDVTGATIVGVEAGQFGAVASTPTTLAPGETAVVDVSFSPTSDGAKSASLVLAHTGANGDVTVPLTGVGVSGGSGGPTVLYRVNAGGPALADTVPWSADDGASPSPYRTSGNIATTSAVIDLSDPTVPAGTPAELFQTERWDSTGGSEMSWSFPTTPGDYEVRLYYAETYAPLFVAGARLFDVQIEGQMVQSDFDQFVAAGAGNRGIVRTFDVTADTSLDLQFLHVVENPAIKAIEILTGGTTGVVADLASSPTALGFGNTQLGSASTLAISLSNTAFSGGDSLQITGATISGAAADSYSHSFGGSPVTLAPGASSSLDVTFAPGTVGAASAVLSIEHTGANSPLVVPLSGTGFEPSGGGTVSFGKSTAANFIGFGARPTSLKWGPDGRLYVARIDGTISIGTIVRNGPNDYVATSTETISSIAQVPNHDDDGTPNPSVTGRMVTGIEVVGTAQNPVIYVVSSDPRIGSPATGDLGMDTNSGILHRLTWNGSTWVKQDLVRGFPRSKEQHSVQGVLYDAPNNDLLLMSGGQTNHGAPSANFQNVPEYALSAAILRVDLDALGAGTYDLPTLDDEDRPGVTDANDPFGGNDGKNQAKLVPGGPVQIYASGLRNPYDAVMTSTGLYTIDNGGNFGWGGVPANEGPAGVCTNAIDNTGPTLTDSLHRITGPGTYGGHPNPTRGNMANTFNASNPQSPVSVADPRECDWLDLSQRGALAFFPASTNGMDQYSTTNFGGAMTNDLVAVGWDNNLYRVDLSADGTSGVSSVLFSNVGAFPLDVTVGDSDSPFPGTMWVADYGSRNIIVFEPADYDGGGFVCTGENSALLDEDSDGYTNADEILNGTDPCSGGDVPSDADGDHVSDRLDTDDDNDGIPDVDDPFAIDAGNGLTTPIPQDFPWDSDTPLDSGILGLGLTGSMANGSTDWLSTYDISNMTVIGAAGVVTVDAMPDGTAVGSANDQQYGLQIGVDARPANADSFEASTSLPNPFGVSAPLAGQSYGLQFGTGGQDDFVEIVLSGDNGGEMQLVREVGGVTEVLATSPITVPGPSKIDIFLWIDPDTDQVQASYTSTVGGVTSDRVLLGSPFTVPSSWFDQGLAVGLIGTSGGAATALNATWDFLRILDAPSPPAAPKANGATLTATPTGGINASTYNNGTMSLSNTSTSPAMITSATIDLSTAILPDMVFDPAGAAGDTLAKDLQINNVGGTGYVSRVLAGPHDGGYDSLQMNFNDFQPGETVTFSIDIDPTSIKGTTVPGPNESGSVSGLEMAGATVTVAYSDGSTQTGRVFGIPGSSGGGQVLLGPATPAAPSLQVIGLPTGSSTATAAQTFRVTGAPGSTVRVLQLESGLFIEAGGFDIDPLESNSATGVTFTDVPIPASGFADLAITLQRSGANAGYNSFVAVTTGAITGQMSNHVLIYRSA